MNYIQTQKTEFSDQVFRKIEMQKKVLSKKSFFDCAFNDCNFTESSLNNCIFQDCEFDNCNLSLVNIRESSFRGVKFKNCKMIGINWTSASWPKIQLSFPIEFDECILDDSTFFGLHLREIKMEACKIHDVDFSEANCEDASFIQSDFLNSRFNRTNLCRADFIDAINYEIDIFNNRIDKAKFNLPEAVSLLHSLNIELLE